MRALLLALLCVLPAASALTAPAAEPAIVSLPGAWLTQYATPVMVVQAHSPLDALNLDIMYHDVVADQAGPGDRPWCANFEVGRCPVFWSRLANLGEEVPVLGVDTAPAGTYTFHCTKHEGMTGTLVVLAV
jgi:hypothetical protein